MLKKTDLPNLNQQSKDYLADCIYEYDCAMQDVQTALIRLNNAVFHLTAFFRMNILPGQKVLNGLTRVSDYFWTHLDSLGATEFVLRLETRPSQISLDGIKKRRCKNYKPKYKDDYLFYMAETGQIKPLVKLVREWLHLPELP